jgi:hypothetical protein
MNTNEFFVISLDPSFAMLVFAAEISPKGKVTKQTTDRHAAFKFDDFYAARDVLSRIVGWPASRVEGVALTRIEQAERAVAALEKVYNDCADDINAAGDIRDADAYVTARGRLAEAIDALVAANERAFRK